MAQDIMVTGRLVSGHPMIYNVPTDLKTGRPRTKADNITPVDPVAFIAVAVPKGAETDWKQTEWGAKIYQEAVSGWSRGEYQMKDFAWKIVDGDSQELNKNMTKPCDKEGYKGHWVLNCQTSLGIKCYHTGKYGPADQIQNAKEIKTGDYCRVLVRIACNGQQPPNTPGLYFNPFGFELVRAGAEIVSGPDAGAMFGGAAPATVPPGAQLDPAVGAPQPPPPVDAVPPPSAVPPPVDAIPPPSAPNMGFLNPPAPPREPLYSVAGKAFTKGQLIAAGWNEAQIAALPPSTGEIPF